MTAVATAPEPIQHFVETDGDVRISVWDHGLGPDDVRPPLLFCHATGFHARVWDPIIAIVGQTYRCVAVDTRGHGDSVLPENAGMEWIDLADDLLDVLDHFGLGNGGLRCVGHSLGASLSLIAEHKRPGTFSTAWLFEPIAIPPSDDPHRSTMSDGARKRREVFGSFDEAYERYTSRPPFSLCDPATIRRYVDYGFRPVEASDEDGVILKCRGETEAQVYDATLRSKTWQRLAEIDGPSFTVVGSGDGGTPAQLSIPITDLLPHAVHEHQDDLNHFGPFQATEAIAASILRAI